MAEDGDVEDLKIMLRAAKELSIFDEVINSQDGSLFLDIFEERGVANLTPDSEEEWGIFLEPEVEIITFG